MRTRSQARCAEPPSKAQLINHVHPSNVPLVKLPWRMERGRKSVGGKLILGQYVAQHLWAVLDYQTMGCNCMQRCSLDEHMI